METKPSEAAMRAAEQAIRWMLPRMASDDPPLVCDLAAIIERATRCEAMRKALVELVATEEHDYRPTYAIRLADAIHDARAALNPEPKGA